MAIQFQKLKQLLVPPRHQQAGQTRRRTAEIITRVRIGPTGPQRGNQIIGPFSGNLRRTTYLAPPVTDRTEVVDTIICHGLPEPLKPFVTSLLVCRRIHNNRDQSIKCLVDGRSQCTAGTVNMLQRRPKLLEQTDRALCARSRIFPRDLFNLGNGFS